MRSNWRPLTCAILSTFFVLLLTACGLSSAKTGYFAGTDSATTVSVALTVNDNVWPRVTTRLGIGARTGAVLGIKFGSRGVGIVIE